MPSTQLSGQTAHIGPKWSHGEPSSACQRLINKLSLFLSTLEHTQVGQLHRHGFNDGHRPAACHDARQPEARVTEQRLPLRWRALAPEQLHLQQRVQVALPNNSLVTRMLSEQRVADRASNSATAEARAAEQGASVLCTYSQQSLSTHI